ncbi:MAG: flagellar export protein FliJ [Clostridiales bacterium]|jgi:flagellar FliJ protein|nr:flagellar export protein FliJ [Clostridiales bacterium]
MKRFTFSLQAVYNLALSTEKQRKTRLARVEAELIDLRAGLNRLKERYLDAKEECAAEMQKGLSSDRLQQYSIYFDSLFNAMVIQKEKIVIKEREREKCVRALIETRREIKTFEKLRETQYEEYLAEERKEAEKDIGDVVSYRVAAK